MNKPIYVTRLELSAFRSLMQGEKLQPKRPIAPNARPTQDANRRAVRTNVAISPPAGSGDVTLRGGRKKNCPDVARDSVYRANYGERKDKMEKRRMEIVEGN